MGKNITEEIQRIAWNCLPKEFKEEVKKEYLIHHESGDMKYSYGYSDALTDFFGEHNLISDAEGEEMLMAPRSKIMKEHAEAKSKMDNDWWRGYMIALQELFGPKCLPDEAQPKQKDCDNPLADKEDCKWRNDGKCAFDSACYFEPLNPQEPQSAEPKEVTKMKPIESKVSVYLATKEEDKEFRMLLHKNGFRWNANTPLINLTCWVPDFEDSKIHFIHPDKTVTYYGNKTSNTLTFSEFKKRYFENVNLSQEPSNCDKHFDNILKDSFSKERRLNIAAMIMASMMQDARWGDKYSHIANMACAAADALIAEADKGGQG